MFFVNRLIHVAFAFWGLTSECRTYGSLYVIGIKLTSIEETLPYADLRGYLNIGWKLSLTIFIQESIIWVEISSDKEWAIYAILDITLWNDFEHINLRIGTIFVVILKADWILGVTLIKKGIHVTKPSAFFSLWQ